MGILVMSRRLNFGVRKRHNTDSQMQCFREGLIPETASSCIEFFRRKGWFERRVLGAVCGSILRNNGWFTPHVSRASNSFGALCGSILGKGWFKVSSALSCFGALKVVLFWERAGSNLMSAPTRTFGLRGLYNIFRAPCVTGPGNLRQDRHAPKKTCRLERYVLHTCQYVSICEHVCIV